MTFLAHTTRVLSLRAKVAILLLAIAAAGGVFFELARAGRGNTPAAIDETKFGVIGAGLFRPTKAQWAMLTVQQVEQQKFRNEVVTEGKIAVDEDRITRVFSPYAGRMKKILARAGDKVSEGQPLFVIEAADAVDAQNDFITAVATLNKARSQVRLNQIGEQRTGNLYRDKAGSLKDWQEAQTNLTAAQNDLRSAEIGLQAVRNRLRLLGKTDDEIDSFEKTGKITADSTVYSPISGTILQRKVGPGQFIDAGASGGDPVFSIGDISKVWLVAYVREASVAKAKVGETVRFTVLSAPEKEFLGKLDFVSSSIDPTSRRLTVRANIDNSEGLLKPEMFAHVTIEEEEGNSTPAVPLQAVVQEGDSSRVWVVREGGTLELRPIEVGLTNGSTVQVLKGIEPGESVVTRGSLFIDRAVELSG
jgi:cobalt-zinc-cadmium efflux system membrane fusion protein